MAESQPDVRTDEGAPRLLIWLAPLLVAGTELSAHVTDRSRRADRSDYHAVAEALRPRVRPSDQVLTTPSFTEPLLREQLGDVLGVSRVGATDLEAFDRVFVVSQRGHGHPDAPHRAPDGFERIGDLTVARFDLGPSPVRYDFVEHFAEAEASLVVGGTERPCPLVNAAPRGGGLGQGAFWPARRFTCDPVRPWVFFGPTVNEDLDLRLRRCLWQHPTGDAPFRVTYRDVPLGERIVIEADLYYEHERNEQHGLVPFELRVKIDGRDAGTMRHVDGDGRVRMTIETRDRDDRPRPTGDVTVEVTSAMPHLHTVCWSGSTRDAPRESDR